ncbi:MAG: hypothetical protein ACK48X_06935, partial [Planctomycetota bacterium]
MTIALDDTIVAIASAPDPAPRGVIRLSGESLSAVLQAAFPESGGALGSISARPSSLPAALPIGENQTLPGRLLVWP